MKKVAIHRLRVPAVVTLGIVVVIMVCIARNALFHPEDPGKTPLENTQETPPQAFAEARSVLTPSITSIDWLYTLRPEADYDGIASSQHELGQKMTELVNALTTEETIPDADSALFCDVKKTLATLKAKLAPFTDFSQLTLDNANEKVLNDIQGSVHQVEQMWADSGKTPVVCSG